MTVSHGGGGVVLQLCEQTEQRWMVILGKSGRPGMFWGAGGSPHLVPKVWLIWTLSHPWWYGVVFRLCMRLGF